MGKNINLLSEIEMLNDLNEDTPDVLEIGHAIQLFRQEIGKNAEKYADHATLKLLESVMLSHHLPMPDLKSDNYNQKPEPTSQLANLQPLLPENVTVDWDMFFRGPKVADENTPEKNPAVQVFTLISSQDIPRKEKPNYASSHLIMKGGASEHSNENFCVVLASIQI